MTLGSTSLELFSDLTGNVTSPLPDVNATLEINAAASDDEECGLFTFIIYVPVFGSMALFGIIGNTMSIIVLQYEKQAAVATWLLQGLAFTDNCFLISAGFAQMFTATCIYFGCWNDNNPAVPYTQVLVWPLVHITQLVTVWWTVLVAANRYTAICKPFQAPLLCTMTKVRLQVFVMVSCCIVYCLPRFFEVTLAYVQDPETGRVYPTVNYTTMKNSRYYKIIYENTLYCIFVFLGPLLILSVLNVLLISELMRARKRLQSRQIPMPGEEEEQNLTLVMIVIMLIFVSCQTPAFINQLLYVLAPDAYGCWKPYYYFYHISNLLISANSSFNFVVYFVFRKQFRERLKNFCRQKRSAILMRRTSSAVKSGRTESTYIQHDDCNGHRKSSCKSAPYDTTGL